MDRETTRGRAVVVQPSDGPSYWQPMPANGHSDPKLFPGNTGFEGLSMAFRPWHPRAISASIPMVNRSSCKFASRGMAE